MGLASKLAAAGGAGGGASAGYPGQPQYQAYNPGQPPQQGVYGQQPLPGQPGQYPPPQQYQQGAYPPPQQQQYQQGGYSQPAGQPPRPAGPQEIAAYKSLLSKCINENQLQSFYPNPAVLDQLAAKGAAAIPGLAARWHIDLEIARDLVQLALYDIVIFIDDSGSMQFAENGERIKDLKLILERVASVATVFDDDGISLRFMNASRPISEMENVRSEQQIRQVIDSATFSGYTPLGSQLRSKVVEGIIAQKLRAGQYNKPHLVIVVTDGEPSEDKKLVRAAVKASADALRSARKPPSGIAFQIAQVGNDEKARTFLATLDEDAELGRLVDCTSNYESESDEMARKGVTLTPDLWLVKLMLGAIDKSYDSKDESGATAGYAPPQGQYGQQQYPPQQYGGPPQQQYGGPPQQQYGAPPPGQYPPQYGAPPPGQYSQPQYPQQGQQNYGRGGPPYPGAPPVPPRY